MYKALVIGARSAPKLNIGGRLCQRLVAPMWRLGCVVTSNRSFIYNEEGMSNDQYDRANAVEFEDLVRVVRPDVGFICIPTNDNGETAWRYAKTLLDAGSLVSTAEKGIMSALFDKAKAYEDRIDFSAGFGGGNRFLYNPKLMHVRDHRRVTAYVVGNATLNCVFWVINGGGDQDEAVKQAMDRGVAEPNPDGGRPDLKTLVNGELPDKVKKGCGFFNLRFADKGEYLTPDDLKCPVLGDGDIARLIDPFDQRRLIMIITNQPEYANNRHDLIAPMYARKGQWHISIGFRSIGSGPIATWLESVPDINNGVLLYVDGHRYSFSGPGAGPATVDALIEGALDKLAERDRMLNVVRSLPSHGLNADLSGRMKLRA